MSEATEGRLVNVQETDDYDVYIGRVNNYKGFDQSRFANPFRVRKFGRETVINLYELLFKYRVETDDEFREAARSLEGKTLGCWCAPEPCHGEVILGWLDSDSTTVSDDALSAYENADIEDDNNLVPTSVKIDMRNAYEYFSETD